MINESDSEVLAASLVRGVKSIGVSISETQVQLCVRYAALLLDYNTHTNLTRITQPADIGIKHFVDSLTVLLACPDIAPDATVADVGTGAGFPGLVLKIARPGLRLTLIDSLAKRVKFLAGIVENLRLDDVTLLHARAEDVGRDARHRDMYDLVTARAVAALPTLLEWCGPLVRVGGRFVAMKSGGVDAELNGAAGAAKSLGLRQERDLSVSLDPFPGEAAVAAAASRRLIVYEKSRRTPDLYPRSAAQIRARPLG